MKSSDQQRLEHIRHYCEDIDKAIQRFGDSYEIFRSDTDYLNSISMSLMQIGELSIGLSDEFKEATKEQIMWGAMRAMRNMYAHAYVKMDKLIIWETATGDIQMLKQFCDRMLEPDRARDTPAAGEKPSILAQLEKRDTGAEPEASLDKKGQPER